MRQWLKHLQDEWPERWMAFCYYIFVALGTVLWPLLAHLQGNTTLPRLGVCFCFLAGAVLSLIGYWRYRVDGKPNALWFQQISKSLAFSALGAGFFVLSIGGGAQPATPFLLIVYAFFGWSASALLYTGLYLFFGAKRGWIAADVSWWPWRRG